MQYLHPKMPNVPTGDLGISMPVETETQVENEPQILRLINKSGGWWHPNHIHSEFGRVLSRNGRSPSPVLSEQDGVGKKDTVILGPGSEVDVFLKFRDYAGSFVFHCHNLAHEDMAMMARFDVTTTPGHTFF